MNSDFRILKNTIAYTKGRNGAFIQSKCLAPLPVTTNFFVRVFRVAAFVSFHSSIDKSRDGAFC